MCHAQYVGSTTTKFRPRFNNHKACLRMSSRLSVEGRDKDDLVNRHFSGPGHHGLEDVRVQSIDRVFRKSQFSGIMKASGPIG